MTYLSDFEQAQVRSSFGLLASNLEALVDSFYSRLFELDPSLRPLFSSDMSEQKKKLQKMLTIVVGLVSKPDVLLDAVRDLGKRHATYGIHIEDFEAVGEALIYAIKNAAGSAYTLDIENSWLKLYGLLSGVMIAELKAQQA